MEKICVIYGGKSVEHDISIITALQTIKKLKQKYIIIPIYIDRNGKWWNCKNFENTSIYSDFEKKAKRKKNVMLDFNKKCLRVGKTRKKIKSCVLCNHGLNGEDGSLAGAFELAQIPYTSSNVLSGGLTMDKVLTKILLEKNSIKTADYFYLCENDLKSEIETQAKNLGFPLIIKPAHLGSSVGIGIAKNLKEFFTCVEEALQFDTKILVEEFLEDAREFNCACFLSDEKLYPSKVVEIEKGEMFSFDEKYIKTSKVKKKKIETKIVEDIKKLTTKVYSICECFGIVRIDYLYKGGEIFVNEINSIPGSLACNFYPNNFNEVLDLVIEESGKRKSKNDEKNYSYKSDALKVYEDLSSSSQKYK